MAAGAACPEMPAVCRLHGFTNLDSTNAEALRRMATGAAQPGDVFVAATQSAGRGRGGRSWHSAAGNLHASVVLPVAADRHAGQLALVAGVAVHEALAALAPELVFTLKWPNDVLCRGRKVAGILIEAGEGGFVVGIGVNLAAAPPASSVRLPATSVLAEGGGRVSPERMLDRLYPVLAAWHRRWAMVGFAPVRAAWQAHGLRRGEALSATTAAGAVDGLFDGLDGDGALTLIDAAGVRRIIAAGDVAVAGRQ